jgi:hypothetical protein
MSEKLRLVTPEPEKDKGNLRTFKLGQVHFMIYEDLRGITHIERDYRAIVKDPKETPIINFQERRKRKGGEKYGR